jgi:type I restriction enzyme S subunit
MSEWLECKFKELFLIPLKNGLTKPSKIRGTGLRMVNMKEIFGFNVIDDKTPMECVPVTENELKSSLLNFDDLLFARQSLTEEGAGKISIFKGKEETVFESHLIRCRIDKNKAKPDFIYYLFKSPIGKGTVSTIVQQVAAAGIKSSDLQNLEFTIPPLPEQKAIAAVLSSLDDKIDLLHRQNKTLEAMAETLFKQWFIIEANEDWENTTLAQHTEVFRGLSYKGNGLTDKGLGLPMHNLNSVYEGGGYKYSGIKYYSGDFKERHLVNTGDIIVTNTEQGHDFKLIGFPAIIPNFFGQQGIFSQHIYKLITKTNSYITKEYLYYLLMTPEVREQVISATNGSTVNMLAIDGLQRPEFKLPPENKVIEFSQFVKSCWQRKENNQKQIQTLETLRDTLLPKLMSGEVRVT